MGSELSALGVGTMRRRVAVALGTVPMAVLLVAGFAKWLDLWAFVEWMRAWPAVPDAARLPLAVAVPLAESLLGLWWFVMGGRRAALVCAGAAFGCFCVAHAWQLAHGYAAPCNCLGLVAEALRMEASSRSMLWINGGLLVWTCAVVVAWPWLTAGPTGPPRALPRAEGAAQSDAAAGAFSLVETLVVVAAIGVLLATSWPALSGARARARETRVLAALRTFGTGVAAYTGDFRGMWPCITDPAAAATVVRAERFVDVIPYFGARYFWHVPLSQGYLNLPWWSREFHTPYLIPGGGSSAYEYSVALIADPAYWNNSTRTGPQQRRATRVDEVLFPSRKTVLSVNDGFDGATHYALDPVLLGMADGAAIRAAGARLLPPASGEGPWPGYFGGLGVPTIHTLDGVRGMDIR